LPERQISRTAFVDGLPVSATSPSARVEVGGAGSIWGDVSHFQPTLANSAQGDIVPGLVIISSCGHSGIVNTIKQAQAVTGIDKMPPVRVQKKMNS
jgi:hypothetical protein